MLYAIFGVLVIILDQWVKYWTAGNLRVADGAREFIPGILNLVNVHNDGAAFSFLSGANAGKFFVILAVAFAVLVVVGLITNFISGRLARWCAVFVAAGGIGNAIDRILYDYVQDMFQFDFFKSFPVFNVADIFICVFCFLFILCIIFGGKSRQDDEDNIEYEEESYEEEEALRKRPSRRGADEFEMDEIPSGNRRSRREAPEAEEEYGRASQDRGGARRRASSYEDSYDRKPSRQDSLYDEEKPSSRRQRPAPSGYDYDYMPDDRQEPVRTEPSTRKVRQDAPSSNPFAEWEAATAADSASKSRPQRSPYTDYSEEAPAPAPRKQPAPAAAEKPAVTSKPKSDSFDLDDILAEFK